MSLFGALVRTAINVVTVPITVPLAIVKDVATLGGTLMDKDPYTVELVKKIKDEAEPW